MLRFFATAAGKARSTDPKDFVKWAQVWIKDAAGNTRQVTGDMPSSLAKIEAMDRNAASKGCNYWIREVTKDKLEPTPTPFG